MSRLLNELTLIDLNQLDMSTMTPLRQVFNQLVDDRKTKTQGDFAVRTGFDEVSMSRMLRGDKPIPFRLLKALRDQFNVDANYIISNGVGAIYLPTVAGDDEPLTQEVQETYGLRIRAEVLEKDLQDCRKQLKDKDRIIDLQYNEIDRLKSTG